MRETLINFLDNVREYVRESGTNIAYDERESSEFVDIYLSEKQLDDENINMIEMIEVLKDTSTILKNVSYNSTEAYQEINERIKDLKRNLNLR